MLYYLSKIERGEIGMSFICAIQMTGLVREEHPSGKHRSNGKDIFIEMAKERASSSETLDRSRTHLNRYDQENHSGIEAWDDMFTRAENFKQPVKCKQKDGTEITRYRKLQNNAVLGVSIIINPPYDECKNWDDDRYQKFYSDTQEILEEINPDIFRKENQVFGVEHFDEGYDSTDRHKHVVYDAISRDGRYCGSQLDALFLSEFNKIYPQRMRERGWKMDDLDTTDWDKYKTDDGYRAERKHKRKSQGKSVNKHIRDKAIKNLKKSESILNDAEEIQEMIDQQLKIAADRSHEIEQLQDDISRLKDEYNNLSISIKKRRAAAEKQLQDRLQDYKDKQLENINKDIQAYRSEQLAAAKAAAQAEADKIVEAAAQLKKENEAINTKMKWRERKLKEVQDYINNTPAVRSAVEKIYYGDQPPQQLQQQPQPQQPQPQSQSYTTRSGKRNKKLYPRPQQEQSTPANYMEYRLPSFDEPEL